MNQSADRQAAYAKGAAFEKQVASWAKRAFKKRNPTVTLDDHANGLTVKRPYQIDVHVQFKGKKVISRWLGVQHDIWIECKWKSKASVKRTDIIKLVASAQDVYHASEAGREDLSYDGLILVSNQKFDRDALRYADQQDVLCIQFDGKTFNELNSPNWLDESGDEETTWLRQVRGRR